MATSRIGLIATASTTYTEPFNLARQFASIDHISNGRVAWNIVTSWLATAARNFGGTGQVSHADRYARGEEFMTVVKALWDSWAADAVIDDRAGGHLCQAGPHPADQPPRRFLPGRRAAQHAALPAGAAGAGAGRLVRHRPPLRRAACRCRVHRPYGEGDGAGILRRSEGAGGGRGADARSGADPARSQPDDRLAPRPRRSAWRARSTICADPEVGRKRLSGRFGGHDFSHLPLDRPLTPEDFPDPGSVEAARSRTEVILNLVRRDRPTLRQLLGYLAGARGHFTTAGTPEQIADLIEDWFTDGAADGFNIMPPLLPAQLDVFSAEVIPLLQRRGLFRTEYAGTTLREHYGLAWPKSAFEEPLLQEEET